MKILVFNSGSSSQKASLYDLREPLPIEPALPLWEGKIEWRSERATFETSTAAGRKSQLELPHGSRRELTALLLRALVEGKSRVLGGLHEIDVVGHRIVNGGCDFIKPVFITAEVNAAIVKLAERTPLHSEGELDGIVLVDQECRGIPQVAVFDSSFHSGLPEAASLYPGPYVWAERGIRKFGFHGISHGYCAERAARLLARDHAALKVVSCHLGNGCSLAAIRGGQSVDTTMGFTPLDGLMMGTRSGSIDPGILTFLLREGAVDAKSLEDMLNTQSGLLGISGFSGDMREIENAMGRGNSRAKLAFDMFVHRLCAGIAAMLAALGGADAIIFTGGIGERSRAVRSAACSGLAFLGLTLDDAKNDATDLEGEISAPESTIRVFVVRAQEDWVIARECFRLQAQQSNVHPGHL